ncbi:MAG: carboxypeptidase-like regulatory domain-containing protein, partial [Cryomorphaceae bacterium]
MKQSNISIRFLKRVGSHLFFLVCFLLPVLSFAQKTIVYGKVFDAATKEALPFVNVAFKGSKVGTTTDLDGKYRLETYYAEDSLMASFVGYKPLAFKVERDESQEINFPLTEGSVSLGEIVVNAKDFENPAHVLLKKIIKNKKINNREKLDAYQYETYNKIEFDLNNLSEKFKERKLFKSFDFIFDNIDSTGEKVTLPFFMTETLSDYYYQRSPKGRKEIIHATKVSGINNESISQFLGQMYQDVNIYQNSLSIFGKNF